MTIPINISIFAHIELDSELSGRFGVQGNTFSNTFGYLNQYFKMLPESDIPPQVTKLAKAMDALVAREHEIKSLRIKSGIAHVSALMNMSSLYDMIGGHSLDKFIVKTAAEINALQAGEDLLLPGGWVGMEGPGHAMIYQFEKSADGELLFSIYNSGAGIDRHEKTSSIEKGLFSPVKTYTIPQPVDATELNHLIKRLIEPQLLPLPEGDSYDDKTLYQSMDASLVFLHAEHKLQDLSTLHNTTASQLSGTCAQRSIHQMLKANFESLPKYQRFIFDFKMHALKDFIATHPSPPRSPRITRFVQKAVTNNLRILQEPGVFDDEQEQAAAVSELQALQQQLQTDEARLISSFFDMNLDFSLLVYAFNAFCAFLNAIYTYFSPHYLVMKTTSFDEASVYDAESVQPALIARVREAHVLADLAEVIKQCQEQHDANPLWVMEQIEKIIIQLPIPTSSNEEKPYYEPIDFYSSITTATDFEAMANSLDGLHALYADAAKKTLREARLPTQLITSASFLLLRDYFDATGEAVTGTPTFHGYFQAKLVSFFQGFRGYPFLATNHPEYDQRLVDLLHAINRYETNPLTEKEQFFIEAGCMPDPVTDYQELLDTDPDLKEELEALYTAQKHGNSRLHQSLREEKVTALYVLLNEFDADGKLKNRSALAAERFEPLIKKVQQRFALEHMFVSCLESFKEGRNFHWNKKSVEVLGNRDVDSSSLAGENSWQSFGCDPDKIDLNSNYAEARHWWTKFIFARYLDYDAPLKTTEKKCITQHKYNLTESSAQTALLQSYPDTRITALYSSNQIQLSSFDEKQKTRVIDKADYFARDLLHLRTSPNHQIKLTLDYFTKSESMAKLCDRNVQLYVAANLFEPGLLLNAFKSDPTFFTRLDAFIQKGLRHFVGSDGLLTHESLFFIRLNLDVQRYAAQAQPDAVSIQRLQNAHDALKQLIRVQHDPEILASLHGDYFLNAMALRQLKPDDDRLLEDTFLSYAYVQAKHNAYCSDDTATRFEQQRAGLDFKTWLRACDPDRIQSCIAPMADSLGLDVSHLTLIGSYPKFQYQDSQGDTVYTVNAALGRVFQNGYSLSAIPLDIINHPVTHRLGLNYETSCWLSEDERIIVFKSGDLRIKRTGSMLAVQKKCLENSDTWYELKPLTDKQQRLLGLEDTAVVKNRLPAILTDASMELWVSETDSLLIHNNKPIYQVDKYNQLHQLDEDGNKTGYVISKTPSLYANALSKFEHTQFFNVNLDQATRTQGTVDFARYGLTLHVSNHQITLPDTNEVLMPAEASPFDARIAALNFSKGHEQRVMVAVQPFFLDQSTRQIPGEYHHLTHDTSGVIPEVMMSKNTSEKDLPAWNHHDTQQSITYKLVDGLPKPDTAADALYLCYLYLATHETEKAWAVLEDISQRLSLDGSLQELRYLSWIVQALPYVLDQEKDTDATFETPEYVACQLKALALYTDYAKLGQSPVFLKKTSFDSTCANGRYEDMCHEEIEKFYNGLPQTVRTLYTRHQRGVRHLDEAFTLRDQACKSLLDYALPHPSEAHGALGYEKRRLSLKTLLKEHQRLCAIRDISSDFPADFSKRLNDLEKNITDELRVMKKSTKLAYLPLNLALSESFEFNKKRWPWEIAMTWLGWQHNNVFVAPKDVNTALGVLNSSTNESDFIMYLPTYLHIARSGTPEQKADLKTFCQHYLMAFRSVLDNKKNTNKNMYFLNHVLYRVLENPSEFTSEQMSLDDLIKKAARCTVPAINVLEARDVFDELLITNREIWEDLQQKMPASEVMEPVSAIDPEPLWHRLGMKDALQAYQEEEKKYTAAMHSGPTEQEAGVLKFECIQAQRGIAEKVFQNDDVWRTLIRQANILEIKQAKNLARIWNDVLDKANAAPPKTVQLLAGQRHLLTQEELLALYLHADMTLYVEKTGLSKPACQRLHDMIHEAVSREVQHQQVVRVLDAAKTDDPHQIAAALMSENMPKAQTDPALMLFQYAENILVRPRQAEALSSLLSKPNNALHVDHLIEKVIMGGGKSKVILPLLAEKKATGLNLVVIEVPRALLATNHVDLNATSQRLFGQKAHRFEFNRDSHCSPEHLESIYETFVEIMSNKAYLVTTGESMQSLELKALELVLSRPERLEDEAQWKKQVYWASKITTLLKERGDVVIDEVHQGLLLKKKLNYTLGDVRAISPELIKHSIALYQFVDCLAGEMPSIDALLTHEKSPLKAMISHLNIEDVRAYLSNAALPESIAQASSDVKDALAFYKEQLTLLPQTSARHYKEHYGPSAIQETALQRALAIPYVASNQPNERSRFGNPMETINYSIQSLLSEGLNEALLKQAIFQWQAEARHELLTPGSVYKTLAETPTAQRVNAFLDELGLTLQAINLRSKQGEAQLAKLLEHLKHKKDVLLMLLQEHILPQITLEPHVLHSDAYNHVDLYRTAQGLSGTPWNHSTYHQRLRYNAHTSLGTDGYIQAVLKNKGTSVTQVSCVDIKSFLEELFETNQNARAIIDINATFAGVSNLEVARQMAGVSAQQNAAIKYVLYFNEADVLCALNISTKKLIILATSDPDEINQKLDCTPDERFTYYDQSHTVGTDLKQATTAHAFVLADKRTHAQSFLQGCMRMRGLDEQQTVSIIVPEDAPTSFDVLFSIMEVNEQNQLKEDNFFAALAKMDNVVRQDFLQRLATVPEEEIEKKYKLAQLFKKYFIETKADTLFEQYGSICIEQSTHDLLERHHKALLSDWKHCLETADIQQSPDEITHVDDELKTIVEKSSSLCNEKTMSHAHPSQVLGVEVEHEKETLKEAEKETLKEEAFFNPKLKEKGWDSRIWVELLDKFTSNQRPYCMQPLNTKEDGMQFFSDNLLVDDNYAGVYYGQEHILCPYLKPVEAIVFRKDGDKVTACLIDMADLALLESSIPYSNGKFWISTTQHTLLSGEFPDDILNNTDYQSLIEQIRFFNGELNGLSEQKTPLCWLNQAHREKMDYFQEHIMPYRQTTVSEFKALEAALVLDKQASLASMSFLRQEGRQQEGDAQPPSPRPKT